MTAQPCTIKSNGCCFACIIYIILPLFFAFLFLVPKVTITAPTTQVVGHSLTLICLVIAVRGITSKMDIVWSSGGIELERMDGVLSTTMGNLLVFSNSYSISQLSTTDDGRVIQCEAVINTNPLVTAKNSITLDITGILLIFLCIINSIFLCTQFLLLQSPYHHLIPHKCPWLVILKKSIVQ